MRLWCIFKLAVCVCLLALKTSFGELQMYAVLIIIIIIVIIIICVHVYFRQWLNCWKLSWNSSRLAMTRLTAKSVWLWYPIISYNHITSSSSKRSQASTRVAPLASFERKDPVCLEGPQISCAGKQATSALWPGRIQHWKKRGGRQIEGQCQGHSSTAVHLSPSFGQNAYHQF